MSQTLSRVTPFFGAPVNNQIQFHNATPRMQGHSTQSKTAPLYFEGPIPKTPVAFGGKSTDTLKIQDSMQTAMKQASMLMTIPLLLGVTGMSYLAGENTELMVVNPGSKTLDIIG